MFDEHEHGVFAFGFGEGVPEFVGGGDGLPVNFAFFAHASSSLQERGGRSIVCCGAFNKEDESFCSGVVSDLYL